MIQLRVYRKALYSGFNNGISTEFETGKTCFVSPVTLISCAITKAYESLDSLKAKCRTDNQLSILDTPVAAQRYTVSSSRLNASWRLAKIQQSVT